MTEDELKAIDERIVVRGGERIYLGDGLHGAMNDICALLAEVRRIKQWEPLKPHCQACGEELFGDYWQPGPACDGIRHAGPIRGMM